MSAPLALFRWTIPVEGVRLVADAEGFDSERDEWRALGDALVPQGDGRREYDPLATISPPLFEVLAAATLEGEALASLAGRVGLLGLTPRLLTSASGRREEREKLDRPVESVAQWRHELLELRNVFELSGAVSALAEARGERHRGRADAARAQLAGRVQPRDFALLAQGSDVERLIRAHPTDLLLAGRLDLRETLDRELARHTRLRMVYDEGMRTLRLRAGPGSLLGAAWLQLAEAAAGGRKARSCLRCAQWFVVKSGRRGHDRYCAAACRQAHQRLRSQARALAAEGRGVQPIAATLRQPAWLVREWIGDNDAKRSAATKRATRKGMKTTKGGSK